MSEEPWFYWWNAPTSAIKSPYPTYAEIYQRNKFYAKLLEARRWLSLQPAAIKNEINIILFQHKNPDNFLINFFRRTQPRLEWVAKKYQLSGINRDVSLAVFDRHFDSEIVRFMASRLVNLTARYNRLPDMSTADIDLLAGDIAHFIRSELSEINTSGLAEMAIFNAWYKRAGLIALQFNVTPPHWAATEKYFDQDKITPAIYRMINDQWWRNRLRRVAAQWREHLQIAVGNVSKKKYPYASKTCVTDWREQKRRTREFLKGLELEDEDGNRISLIDKYDGSVANPAIRRCELMTRIRGFENICEQQSYVGEFYTITAPSKYHATTKAGYKNHKWNGSDPAETQKYLTNLWARVRAKLHREEIRIFGIRVAEPHHDGTPHWHLLMFMRQENITRVREVIRDYAYAEEAHELTSDKARKARFYAETLDPKKGSATGYIAKYISKNIDGFALDDEVDHENGEPLKKMAPSVSAWAARWHIRQFQFVGGAPVTIYRELRRLADTEAAHGMSVEFAAVHDAADAGDWAEYVNTQGGAFVRRDELLVRNFYQPSKELNQYGEEIIRIRGVYDSIVGSDVPILTRTTQWKIVPKKVVDLDVDVKGANAPSWSSVNNCTEDPFFSDDFDHMPTSKRKKLLKFLREKTKRKIHYRRSDDDLTKKIHDFAMSLGMDLSTISLQRLRQQHVVNIEGIYYRARSDGSLYVAKMPFSDRKISIMQRVNNLVVFNK